MARRAQRTGGATRASAGAAGAGPASRAVQPPPPPTAPPTSPPRQKLPSPTSAIAKISGGFAPLAVAAIALALPQPQPVKAAPEQAAAVQPAAPADAQPLQVPAGNATPQCLARYEFGLPHHGADDVAARNVLLCRRGYALSFNADTRDPDWVIERLSAAELSGSARRRNNFRPDDALVPPGADASNADYLRSGYDRGHQAAAGDAKFDQSVMDQSFFFTNMAPQTGIGFNRGAWRYLEETVRGWILCGGHQQLYVITGPIYGRNPHTIGLHQVYVPREFFKIVYDPDRGQAVGFIMPNLPIGATVDLQLYVHPIAEIESETGLEFFPGFDERSRALIENGAGTAWGHGDTCASDGGD